VPQYAVFLIGYSVALTANYYGDLVDAQVAACWLRLALAERSAEMDLQVEVRCWNGETWACLGPEEK
jgi:hypothetical protein